MIVKSAIIIVILTFLFISISGARIKSNSSKKVKCYNPSKPEDMPQDVYEKYKISSRNLTNHSKKDFWQKFSDWWQNIISKVKTFFEKVGNFFKNLFSGNKNKNQTTEEPSTPVAPTPEPQRNEEVFCVEDDENSINDEPLSHTKAVQTTNSSKNKELLTTVPSKTTITKVDNAVKEQTSENSYPTPNGPERETKEREPVIIGIENKDKRNIYLHESHLSDRTVVKDA